MIIIYSSKGQGSKTDSRNGRSKQFKRPAAFCISNNQFWVSQYQLILILCLPLWHAVAVAEMSETEKDSEELES